MKHFVITDSDGRITATSRDFHLGDNEFEFDFPEGFDFDRQGEYKIVNGECVHSPVSQAQEKPSQLDIIEAQVVYTAMMTDTLLEV